MFYYKQLYHLAVFSEVAVDSVILLLLLLELSTLRPEEPRVQPPPVWGHGRCSAKEEWPLLVGGEREVWLYVCVCVCVCSSGFDLRSGSFYNLQTDDTRMKMWCELPKTCKIPLTVFSKLHSVNLFWMHKKSSYSLEWEMAAATSV